MGETIILRAADGFGTTAYVARPVGKPKGALVVIQEIFGVNRHMRGVADGFARDGYLAIVPALFDRIGPGIQLGYAEADVARGRELKGVAATDAALLDIAAARDAVRSAGRVGAVGYCWGGFLAWVSATRLKGFAASVSYYGGGIGGAAAEKPSCPVQFHFGDRDHAIPMTEVEKLRAAGHKAVEIHVYPAGHGFNCDERGSYDAASARTARTRALAFLDRHVAGLAAPVQPPAPAKAAATASKPAEKTKPAQKKKKAAAKKPAARPKARKKAAAKARKAVPAAARRTTVKAKAKAKTKTKAKTKAKAKAKARTSAKRIARPARKKHR